MHDKRKLILQNGEEYQGVGFGDEGEKIVEVVFNTSMAGYQEIFSDPSYTDQGVVMTYPLIGNYGMAAEDYETKIPTIGAMLVREYNPQPSNFRAEETLEAVMKRYGVAGLQGIDTRRLTRTIRSQGSQRGLLTAADTPLEAGLARLESAPVPKDAVSRVSCKAAWVSEATVQERFHVVAIDCGMKLNILRSLNARGCRVTVVPWNTSAEDILALKPNGVFLSNGPGDPTDVPEVIATVQKLRGVLPIFGICLGHQILCLSYGARTYKLKFGHRGGNHPVRQLSSGKIEITAQNHSYAVEGDSLDTTPLQVTHVNLLDGTVEGVCCKDERCFSVQYHPESAPGPQDSAYLFDRFIAMMEEEASHA